MRLGVRLGVQLVQVQGEWEVLVVGQMGVGRCGLVVGTQSAGLLPEFHLDQRWGMQWRCG